MNKRSEGMFDSAMFCQQHCLRAFLAGASLYPFGIINIFFFLGYRPIGKGSAEASRKER